MVFLFPAAALYLKKVSPSSLSTAQHFIRYKQPNKYMKRCLIKCTFLTIKDESLITIWDINIQHRKLVVEVNTNYLGCE